MLNKNISRFYNYRKSAYSIPELIRRPLFRLTLSHTAWTWCIAHSGATGSGTP